MFPSLLLHPLAILLRSSSDDPPDQRVGDWRIERESQIPLWPRVARERPLQARVSSHGRIDPDVALEGREVDENAVESEARHPVADPLRRGRGRLADGLPDLPQDRSNLGREL